jgi:hypothetical protein
VRYLVIECSESDRLSLVPSNLIHASLIVCESVLTEKTGLVSAIRIMDVLTIRSAGFAHFFTLTRLHSTQPPDLSPHVLAVRAVGLDGVTVASGEPYPFVYGYGAEPSAPGGFTLTTEFNLDSSAPGGTYDIQAWLDLVLVARASLTLRRQ